MSQLPRVPARMLRALLPLAERDEVLGDIAEEFAARSAADRRSARRWVWRQVLGSIPALVRRSWWRGRTGFEPRANAMRTGGPLMERWLLDVRYSLRRLRRRPTYVLLAVVTLALGVGGTAAIAAIARALFLDPLPYRDESQLAMFWNPHDWTGEEVVYMRPEWREAGFVAVAAYRTEDVTLEQSGSPARLVRGIASTSELFDVLGTPPALGRGFQPGDDDLGAEPVVVLSNGLWRELGGSPDILGSRLRLDGIDRTVVGVAPRGFWFPDPSTRVWVPVELNPEARSGIFALVGRLQSGRDMTNAGPQLERITTLLDERFDYMPQWDKTQNASLTPLRDHFLGPMRPAILATLGAMALILIIASANVSALLLGQLEGRAMELGVRTALGAERGRLLSQIVIESLVIAFLAGVSGALLAVAGLRVLAESLPLGAWGERATLDWTLFAAAMAIALVAALAVAALPALALHRADLRGVLSRARTGGLAGRRAGLQSGLVVAEVAVAVLLAAGAALLVRSVERLYEIDPGVSTEGIAVLDVALPANVPMIQRLTLLRSLIDEMSRVPGVQSAAASAHIPLRHTGDNTSITIPGRPDLESATTYFRFVSPDYFDVMGIALRSGRAFTEADRPTDNRRSEVDVVINEALAKTYFEPGVDPVGRYTGGGFGVPERVIGVVRDAAEGTLTEERQPTRYYMQDQIAWVMDGQTLVMRLEPSATEIGVLDAARSTLVRAAPSVAVQEATTMESIFATAVGPARQVMSLLSILTALALILGAVGVYGVVAQVVSRRLRDWSIRMALGLEPSRVIGQVVRFGAGLAGIGIVLGIIAAAALSRLLRSLLYGVGSSDPMSFGAAGLALLIVASLAALIPAIRASRADPAMVLREQ